MGLFDGFALKKWRKEKDAKIAKAQQLMKEEKYQTAYDILWGVLTDLSDNDFEYREDEISEMADVCKSGIEKQKEREKQAKLAEKDRLIEEIRLALAAGNWRKAIELLDRAEDNYDRSHRSFEMEDLCIEAQEMCFDSDEVNGWEDAVYSRMYMRKKESYIGMAQEMVEKGKISVARDALLVLDRRYNSAYMDDAVEKLWAVVMDGKNKPGSAAATEETACDTQAASATQKDEALARLDTLAKEGRMDGKPYIWFKNDILCGSLVDDDGTAFIKELGENDDLYMLSKQFEEELGCLVYHAVDSGRTAYLLTVHRDADRWAEERPQGDKIRALIFSLYEDDYHYDWVKIFNNNGALGIEEIEDSRQEENTAEATEEVTEEITEEPAEAAEKIPSEIDGKDREEWYNRGYRYYYGENVQQDYALALAAFETSGKLGNIEAMRNCAMMYRSGLGCEKDLYKAFFWTKKGADAGDADMMWDAAKCYYNGNGCEKDEKASDIRTLKAAENGCKEAYYSAGILYYSGDTVQQDFKKALYWFEKSAMSGNSNAMEYCGDMYSEGKGCEKDYDKAGYWLDQALQHGNPSVMTRVAINKLKKAKTAREYKEIYQELALPAAEKGYGDAMVIVADMLFNGQGVEQDQHKAVEWLEKAAEKGNQEAIKIMVGVFKPDDREQQPQEQYYYWLEKYAQSGDVQAMVDFGLYCLNKKGADEETLEKGFEMLVEAGYQDNVEALLIVGNIQEEMERPDMAASWYERAAELGDTAAMERLLDIYVHNRTEENEEKRFRITEKLAELKGAAVYYSLLGDMYLYGMGCRQDNEKAIENYIIASEKGDLDAKKSLADIYNMGEICPKDVDKAFELNSQLARRGNRSGLYSLGVSYLFGEGCEKDLYKAFEYFSQAASQDYAPGYYGLANCYEKGDGCEINIAKAYEMYKKALDGGVEKAREKVEFYARMYDAVEQATEEAKEIAKKYINSTDPEMRKMARELLGIE